MSLMPSTTAVLSLSPSTAFSDSPMPRGVNSPLRCCLDMAGRWEGRTVGLLATERAEDTQGEHVVAASKIFWTTPCLISRSNCLCAGNYSHTT